MGVFEGAEDDVGGRGSGGEVAVLGSKVSPGWSVGRKELRKADVQSDDGPFACAESPSDFFVGEVETCLVVRCVGA